MTQTPAPPQADSEFDYRPSAEIAHSMFRLAIAVRYRKNLVVAVMAAAVLLGGLYYATATRRYSAKAQLLVTQTGRDHLDTSITNEESQRQNTMPTFENMVRSAKVLEGALKNLSPGDRIDLAGSPQERWIGCLQDEPDGQGDPIDQHPGGELSLEGPAGGGERGAGGRSVVPRFHGQHAQGDGRRDQPDVDRGAGASRGEAQPQAGGVAGGPPPLRRHGLPLATARRSIPTVQRAVSFNDALIAAQKQRVEQRGPAGDASRRRSPTARTSGNT